MKPISFAFIFFTWFFILRTPTVTAQEKLNNSIRFYTGDFVVAKFKFPESPFIAMGISYAHRVGCKNWVGLKIMKLDSKYSDSPCFDFANRYRYEHVFQNGITGTEIGYHHFFVRKILQIELSFEHMFYIDMIHNRIGLSASIESSTMHIYRKALGEITPNGMKIIKYINPNQLFQIGFVPGIMYEYNFLKERINIGADLRFHIYDNLTFQRTDLLFHGGANF